jgi:hypothetical protein
MLIENVYTYILQITRQHVSTFQALKLDFVASCSNFVARITPALTNLSARNIFSRPQAQACFEHSNFFKVNVAYPTHQRLSWRTRV